MMWMSSKGPQLSRISMNYGDDGMKMGNERYAFFGSAYEEWVMKKEHKKKDLGLWPGKLMRHGSEEGF